MRAARWEGRAAILFDYLKQQERRLNGTVLNDDEQEATELALTDLLEATQEQLQRNNFKKIEDETDELLQSHKLTLSKSSDAYRRLCQWSKFPG